MSVPDSILERYRRDGAVALTLPAELDAVEFLRRQAGALCAQRKLRPWHLHELHNPWSRAATVCDAWGFLDLCQNAALLRLLVPLLGPDIVLYDSELSPDTSIARGQPDGWQCDLERCPVEPAAGIVVRIGFAGDRHGAMFGYSSREERSAGTASAGALPLGSGRLVVHDIGLRYRLDGAAAARSPFEYVARYFPASSRYIRDPATDVQRRLTERYPLINYGRLPLWLVHGEDRAGNDFATGFQTRVGRWVERGRSGPRAARHLES